jgi:hypothetical protein
MNTKLNRWTLALAAVGLVSAGSIVSAADPATTTTNDVASSASQSSGTNAPPTTEAGTVIGSKANEGIFKRLGEAFREQLGTAAYTEPAPPVPGAPVAPSTRRANPAPFDSPPYPNGEWQIGGTEIIGDGNLTPDYPVMQALYQGLDGDLFEKTRIKMYGWVDFSGNLSSSHNSSIGANGQSGNFPLIYPQRPNRFEMDQAVLYFERTPDENQTDHVDWGFRIASVYGLDYRYMISYGLFSDQLLKGNKYYGFDMPMIYGNLYFPKVADGLNITIGRIISEADIEAQLAPNNLMSTHSLLYSFDPYTQEGIFGTLKLNNQWTVQAGLANGGDVAIWQKDRGNQPTGTIMVQYQSKNNKFSFYGGANQFNNGDFGYNNLQQFVGTFTYKFTDRLWTTWETWYMYQKNAITAPSSVIPFQNAFYPVKPGYAPEWASVDYTMYRLGRNSFLTLRNEVFDDIVGQRTGYNTVYSEHSIGLTYWPSKLITFRPELRFDHSYAKTAYDNGTRHNQLVASFDVIFHF